MRALDLGINLLDPADTYGIGDDEELVGKTIRGRRDEVFIATKFANVRKKDDPTSWRINGKPEYVKAACDQSLNGWASNTLICPTSMAWTPRRQLKTPWVRWRG